MQSQVRDQFWGPYFQNLSDTATSLLDGLPTTWIHWIPLDEGIRHPDRWPDPFPSGIIAYFGDAKLHSLLQVAPDVLRTSGNELEKKKARPASSANVLPSGELK